MRGPQRSLSQLLILFFAKGCGQFADPCIVRKLPAPFACILRSALETSQVKAIAIIPARLASTRLSRKVLREIDGRPMLAYVYEAARACPQLQDVIVATDSEEIAAVCRQNGWSCRLTSPQHRSGTDRVHEVAQAIRG